MKFILLFAFHFFLLLSFEPFFSALTYCYELKEQWRNSEETDIENPIKIKQKYQLNYRIIQDCILKTKQNKEVITHLINPTFIIYYFLSHHDLISGKIEIK